MKNFTTWEKLSERISSYGAILEYKGHIIKVDQDWKKGYVGEVYEFIDEPEETGLAKIECRLSRIAESDIKFEDNGTAMQWCFKQI